MNIEAYDAEYGEPGQDGRELLGSDQLAGGADRCRHGDRL